MQNSTIFSRSIFSRSMIMTATLTSALLVGCNETPEIANTPTQTSSAVATEVTTAETQAQEYVSPLPDDAPVYTVGISAGYAPFEFKDEFGKIMGYDVDLIRAIGEESGFKVEFHESAVKDLQASLADGKYDFGMSSSFKKNGGKVKASEPYLRSHMVFLVKRDSPYKTVTDLKDAIVAVQKNTIFADKLKKELPSAKPEAVESIFLATQAVFTGKAEAVIGEEPILIYQSESFADYPVRFIFSDKPKQSRVVLSAADNKDEIIDKVNEGIQAIKANGRYQKINEKWFGMYATSLEAQ